MIAVDANIALEILEERAHLKAVMASLVQHQLVADVVGISTLSVSHVFYLAESHKIPFERVEAHIKGYQLYSVIDSDVAWALEHYEGKDFEDALQVAAARREKCTAFLTLDAPLAKKYAKFLNVELIRHAKG